jgi:hypothetical protein
MNKQQSFASVPVLLIAAAIAVFLLEAAPVVNSLPVA